MDGVELQILWSNLIGIVSEQARALQRIAFSPIVREAGDLANGLFDEKARMVAQAVTGTPGHINSLAAAARNQARGYGDMGLFEVGPQFPGSKPEDQQSVASGIRVGKTGPRHWAAPPRDVDAYDAKADAQAVLADLGLPADRAQVTAEAPGWYHPGRSGALRLGPMMLAAFGELHPAVLKALDVKGPAVGFEIYFDNLPAAKAKKSAAKAGLNLSALQPVNRDFAFVVDAGVEAASVIKAAFAAEKGLIVDVSLFDVYEGQGVGEGKKSLAINVVLQPADKTLTDADIDAVADKVIASVVKATGGELRG